jgi:hypothetical protein
MLLITKPPAISPAATSIRKDHPPPVLGRLLATGAGRSFFMELPASPIVLVRAVGRKLLTKLPPRSMVSLAEPMAPPELPPELPTDPLVSDSSLPGSFLSGGGVLSGGVASSGGKQYGVARSYPLRYAALTWICSSYVRASRRDSSRSRSRSMRCMASSPILPSLRRRMRVWRCARSSSLNRRW